MSETPLYLYAMNRKGLAVLEGIVRELGPESMAAVIGARDQHVHRDYYEEIRDLCAQRGIPFLDRSQAGGIAAQTALAVGWRWMIQTCSNLIVLHDSLLPRYRGFAPLPTALINGDPEVGVTALLAPATREYDRGEIIGQKRLPVEYPAKIQDVIERISALYVDLAVAVARDVRAGSQLKSYPQNESEATYSQWRDEDDYRIEWSRDACFIKRFIDALGFPYRGASAEMDGVLVRILEAAVEPDIAIEQRTAGKVIFLRDQLPVVTCGRGLLRLLDVRDAAGESRLLPLAKFRVRFR
jgi:methionyl-tRNA formyltransferase